MVVVIVTTFVRPSICLPCLVFSILKPIHSNLFTQLEYIQLFFFHDRSPRPPLSTRTHDVVVSSQRAAHDAGA